MEILPDFKELFALLNANQVEYVIAGGYAMAYHGSPRYTGDIDIYIRPEPANARNVLKTLDEFGIPDLDLTEQDLTTPDQVIQIGVEPMRVDLLTSLDGVTWDEVRAGCASAAYGDVQVLFIGKRELIRNKKATNRLKDRADLEALDA